MTPPAQMPEPFDTIQQAIITKLDAGSMKCYDHMPLELYATPSAYLQPTDAVPAYLTTGHGDVGIGEVPYALRYFVSLEQDPRRAWVVALDGVRAIYDAFEDTTLGGQVRSASLARGVSIDAVEMGKSSRPMLMVEAIVTVKPTQYA